MNLSGTFSLANLDAFTQQVIPLFLKQKTLLLEGPLGAGKTTFAKALLLQMNPLIPDIQSPSFPIMIPYETPYGKVWHMDFYRLSEHHAWEELEALGISEILHQDFSLIEWPSRCLHALSGLHLALSEHAIETHRHYHLTLWPPSQNLV